MIVSSCALFVEAPRGVYRSRPLEGDMLDLQLRPRSRQTNLVKTSRPANLFFVVGERREGKYKPKRQFFCLNQACSSLQCPDGLSDCQDMPSITIQMYVMRVIPLYTPRSFWNACCRTSTRGIFAMQRWSRYWRETVTASPIF